MSTFGLMACLACSGCTKATGALVSSSAIEMLEKSLPRVTNDFQESCERRNVLRADVPKAEGVAAPLDCAPYANTARRVEMDQAVLMQYLEAVGQLTVNATPAYPAAFQRASGQVSLIAGVSAQEAAASTAAGGIAAALAEAATKHYRRSKLRQIVPATDANIQQLCAALERVVGADYGSLLDDEELETRTFYDEALAERREGQERLALVLVVRQRDQEMAALARRRSAAQAYVTVMTRIAKLHAQVAQQERDHAGDRQLAERSGPDLALLKEAINDLEERLH